MSEIDDLSSTIESLYDAAVEPARWTEALEKSTRFVQGCGANLFWQDAATNEAITFHSWGCDSEYEQLYFEKYASLNPFFPALAFVEIGKAVAAEDLIPHEEFRQTRFFKEWVAPQGLIDVLGVNLERTATTTAFFSVRRSEENGIVDEGARRRCALIAPHMRRAVSVGKVVQNANSTKGMLQAALEQVAAAVVFVSANGRAVFANQAAETMLRSKQVLVTRRGIVGAANASADKQLREALAAASRGDSALGLKGIDIPLVDAEGRDYIANVLSIVSEGRRVHDANTAVAALFVREITLVSPTPLEAAARRYGLTPSELRVLAAVLEAGRITDIADRLGVSKATVKTHLNHLMAKTGARRQTDLIRMVVGGSPKRGGSIDGVRPSQPKG